MKLGILMSLVSPWSRDVAIQLSLLGHEVFAVDVDAPSCQNGYLSISDCGMSEEIAMLREHCTVVHSFNFRVSNKLRYLAAAPKLYKFLRLYKVDVLLTLYGGGLAAAAFISRFRPYSVYCVGSDILKINSVYRLISRQSLASAKVVFANGDYLAEQAKKISPKANIAPLLLGTNTDDFSPNKSISNGPIKIICSRGFQEVYNNQYILQALERLNISDLPDFELIFTSPGLMLQECKKIVRETLHPAVQRRIQFLGGVSRRRLIDELRSSDIYISVSKSDGTSTAVLEALSCGLFPILSDIPQNRPWIDSKQANGFLVPLHDPTKFGQAIENAIVKVYGNRTKSDFNRNLVVDRADSKKNMAILSDKLSSMVG